MYIHFEAAENWISFHYERYIYIYGQNEVLQNEHPYDGFSKEPFPSEFVSICLNLLL